MLIDEIVDFCNNEWQTKHCLNCNCIKTCKRNCKNCLDDLHFHKNMIRKDYDCEHLLDYYVCRYSYKYCSEIIYALNKVDLTRYTFFNILSIGCGGAPDLMAFEEMRPSWDTTKIFYKGYDINRYWNTIHKAIKQYTMSKQDITAEFIYSNIFDVFRDGQPTVRHYNVIILGYLLSHFSSDNRRYLASVLFKQLIQVVISNRLSNSPFLFIINDIDHYSVRSLFDILLDYLDADGYTFSYQKVHFKYRNSDYNDGSVQFFSDQNKFSIPDNIVDNYCTAIKCSSAQLILEVS